MTTTNYRQSTETGRVEAAGAREETGCRLPGDPYQGNKGILKLSVVVTAQLCEYTKATGMSVCSKGSDRMVCASSVNKMVTKQGAVYGR